MRGRVNEPCGATRACQGNPRPVPLALRGPARACARVNDHPREGGFECVRLGDTGPGGRGGPWKASQPPWVGPVLMVPLSSRWWKRTDRGDPRRGFRTGSLPPAAPMGPTRPVPRTVNPVGCPSAPGPTVHGWVWLIFAPLCLVLVPCLRARLSYDGNTF